MHQRHSPAGSPVRLLVVTLIVGRAGSSPQNLRLTCRDVRRAESAGHRPPAGHIKIFSRRMASPPQPPSRPAPLTHPTTCNKRFHISITLRETSERNIRSEE